MSKEGITYGQLLGGILAGALSYAKWGSILLAIVQGGLLGWIYVIYFAIRYGFHNLKF